MHLAVEEVDGGGAAAPALNPQVSIAGEGTKGLNVALPGGTGRTRTILSRTLFSRSGLWSNRSSQVTYIVPSKQQQMAWRENVVSNVTCLFVNTRASIRPSDGCHNLMLQE